MAPAGDRESSHRLHDHHAAAAWPGLAIGAHAETTETVVDLHRRPPTGGSRPETSASSWPVPFVSCT